jgi:hypothetical protein
MKWIRTAAALALLATPGFAQESRGSIRGRVTDSSGAVIPGASVTVTNVNTNARASGETNEEGNFDIPYLLPGSYEVAVERQGFAKALRENIEIRVGDRLTLDFDLKLGGVADSIVVNAETPLLETANASIGIVMDEKRIRELPVIGGNAFYLTRLSPGVTVSGGRSAGNPMDLGAASGSAIVNGTRTGSSEVTLDGVPNMQEGNAAFVPPQDLVQEFKIQTTTYDATLGHAAGAVVNVSVKSGTNQLHGSGYYFDSRIRAIPWFSNNYLYDPATGPIDDRKRQQANPGWLHQRWGATLTGPVFLPKLYDGRNRTFWSFGWEGLHIGRQPTFFATVPTADELKGDFSALLKLGSLYQIYDPATIRAEANGRFSRQPIPGNLIPANRIDPIAAKILSYYPAPNTAGTADGRQNYFGVQREPKDYSSFIGRVDQNFSENHRAFARWNTSGYLTGVQRLPTIAAGTVTRQRNYGVVVDDVYVINPQLVLNLRAGLTFFRNAVEPTSRGFDITTLGYPASLVSAISAKTDPAGLAFPVVLLDGSVSTDNSGYENISSDGGTRRATTYDNFSGVLTRLAGNHSMRMGGEFRVMRESGFGFGNVAPRFEFNSNWTRGPVDNSPTAPISQGLASLLLGYPTGGRVNVNASRAQQSTYSALYLHDDWKLTRRLTVNLGLRYERETPITERFNRSIRGFDFASPSPIQAAAVANYGKAPLPEIPAAQFRTFGGLTFAGVNGQPRGIFDPDRNNIAPRVGLAYELTRKTVLRAGYGLFYDPTGADQRDVNQGGFNQPTTVIASNDNGLTFQATLARPFPNGIDTPAGASAGLATFLGRGVTYFTPRGTSPYMQRWSFSVQQELPARVLVDTTYVGNRGNRIWTSREWDFVPRQYLSTQPFRDQAAIDFLSAQVTNPFFGIPEFAGTGLASNRVARSQLLRPYPHFTSVATNEPIGFSWYHSLQVSAQKRFTRGLTIQLAWTWSKFMEATGFLNDSDAALEHVVSDQDFPHRLIVSGIYDLPFGRGKRFGRGANRLLDALVGGWQLQAWYEGQSGQALGFGNSIFLGNLRDVVLPKGERSISRWFNTANFERNNARSLANNIRVMSSRFTGIRSDGINNLDASLFKNYRLAERMTLQFRFETYNTANHVQLGNPNTTPTNTAFGTITAEKGHGQRQLTFALKLLF